MKVFIILLSVVLTACASKSSKEKSPAEKKAMIYYTEGTRQLVDQKYTKALKNLLEANRLLPNNTKICNNLGMAYYLKGNKERAIRYIQNAIQVDAKNTDARINLATIYMNQGRLQLAENQYKVILEDLVYEGQFKTYYNLGVLSKKRARTQEAIKYFKKSLDINEGYCPAHYELGKIAMSAGAYPKAYQYFKDAGMGVCYNNPEPFYMQAMALIKLGRFEQAQNKLESIMGRFDKGRFAILARKKLSMLRNMKKSRAQDNLKATLKLHEDLSTPDF